MSSALERLAGEVAAVNGTDMDKAVEKNLNRFSKLLASGWKVPNLVSCI